LSDFVVSPEKVTETPDFFRSKRKPKAGYTGAQSAVDLVDVAADHQAR